MRDTDDRTPSGVSRGSADEFSGSTDESSGCTDRLPESAERSSGSSDGSPEAAGEWAAFAREVLTTTAGVVAIGLLLFAISGVWPPLVAVESASMEPNMYRTDLIFVTEPGRFVPEYDYDDTGIVPAEIAAERGYSSLGESGSVIVYDFPRNDGSPIIHRVRFHVDRGENWYDRADPEYVGGAENCEELARCPAPHAGFITKGDNEESNPNYDQVSGIAPIVRESWVRGVAHARIPYLGWVRLTLSKLSTALHADDGAPVAGFAAGSDTALREMTATPPDVTSQTLPDASTAMTPR